MKHPGLHLELEEAVGQGTIVLQPAGTWYHRYVQLPLWK